MDARTVNQRLDDLEHDNNVLRQRLSEIQTENTRLSISFEQVCQRCDRLIAKVNEFVNRFNVVQ